MANIYQSRKSGFTLRGGRRVRETLWAATAVIEVTEGAAATATLLSTFGAGILALRPFTIMRTRGTMYLETDTPTASEQQAIHYGHAVVSDQATAIGVTAVPTPGTDAGSDLWFVYEVLMSAWNFTTDGTAQRGIGKDFDSRAMRKVEDGSDAVSVFETAQAGSSAGVIFRVQFRQLIKLH